MEKLLGIRDVYMKTVMSSNYKGDIFYTRDQVEQAIRSAYTDTDREIVSDYRGIGVYSKICTGCVCVRHVIKKN